MGTTSLQLITVAEAASRLAVHEDTVRAMLRDGRLSPVRIGRAVRVEEAELEALVSRGRPRRNAPPATQQSLTSGQNRALHARAGDIEKRAGLERGTAKRRALAAASLEFGREIEGARQLTEDEASWTIEWLGEMQDRLA